MTRSVPDPLPSWRAGEARRAILRFVDRVSTSASPEFVPPAGRVAVLDNDGTLWCERPAYPQASFILERLSTMAAADPDLATRPMIRALLAGDLEGARNEGMSELSDVLLSTHAGLTTEDFAEAAGDWFARARHPRFGTPYSSLVYAPMLELVGLLRVSSFRVFVVTGGGVEFVRAVSDPLYGIPPDDVVGSAVELSLERRDGRIVLVRRATMRGSPNEGVPKALNIQAHIGVRPIFGAGNSAGDREMLEYVSTGPGATLSILIDHDDADREYAYSGASFTDPDAEPATETARRLGWTTVSMREDWATIFAPVGQD